MLLSKKILSNLYFCENFLKFVVFFSLNYIYHNFFFFFQQCFAKMLFCLYIDKYYCNILINQQKNLLVLLFLKKHYQIKCSVLLDISITDNYSSKNRFFLTYILQSFYFVTRLFVKIQLATFNILESIIKLYRNAIWMEREIWDFFGLWFSFHEDLRRLLTDYNFFGHPLRKEFPLTGYYELYYDEYYTNILKINLSLQQNYRAYILKNFWIC